MVSIWALNDGNFLADFKIDYLVLSIVVVVVVETAHYGKENLLVVLKRSSQLMWKESGVVSYCVAVSGGWWNVSWNG